MHRLHCTNKTNHTMYIIEAPITIVPSEALYVKLLSLSKRFGGGNAGSAVKQLVSVFNLNSPKNWEKTRIFQITHYRANTYAQFSRWYVLKVLKMAEETFIIYKQHWVRILLRRAAHRITFCGKFKHSYLFSRWPPRQILQRIKFVLFLSK